MKSTYTLHCRNGYNEHIRVHFEAYNILEAKEMALIWMKRNFIRTGRIAAPSGKDFYVSW